MINNSLCRAFVFFYNKAQYIQKPSLENEFLISLVFVIDLECDTCESIHFVFVEFLCLCGR